MSGNSAAIAGFFNRASCDDNERGTGPAGASLKS
jgi:hypothetical protein